MNRTSNAISYAGTLLTYFCLPIAFVIMLAILISYNLPGKPVSSPQKITNTVVMTPVDTSVFEVVSNTEVSVNDSPYKKVYLCIVKNKQTEIEYILAYKENWKEDAIAITPNIKNTYSLPNPAQK